MPSPFLWRAKFDWSLSQGGGHFIEFIQRRKFESNSKPNPRLTFFKMRSGPGSQMLMYHRLYLAYSLNSIFLNDLVFCVLPVGIMPDHVLPSSETSSVPSYLQNNIWSCWPVPCGPSQCGNRPFRKRVQIETHTHYRKIGKHKGWQTFYKGPDRKYFWFCGPYCLCHYSTLVAQNQPWTMIIQKWMCVFVFR